MNLRDLHYFVVLAELKHFGETAKRCFVSQPTLSMQIKKLEETLGVPLFERSNKQVLLTDQGKALLSRAKMILGLVDEIKEIAKQSSDPFAGELHLGVIPTVAPYLLPLLMPHINKKYPNLKIWLVEEQTQNLLTMLQDGVLDAAIMAHSVAREFSFQNLYEEEFFFACASQHEYAQKQSLAIADLANQPILLLEEGHCLREQAMSVCKMAKNNDIADFTATSLETLRLMVQGGMGVTLLPALASLSQSSNLISYIPFVKPVPTRTLALFWRPGSPKTQCLRAIAQCITDLVEPKLNKLAGTMNAH